MISRLSPMQTLSALIVGLLGCGSAFGQVSVAYQDPGWTYAFDGSAAAAGTGPLNDNGAGTPTFDALDGSWCHNNGSDAWDGVNTGPDARVFTGLDGTTTFLTLDDASTSGSSGVNNRKLYFVHDISAEGASPTLINSGVTLSFRARLTPQPPGLAGPDGYLNSSSGHGMFGIRQINSGLMSFSLTTTADTTSSYPTGRAGLMLNGLNGTVPSSGVDPGDSGVTDNVLEGFDPVEWHEFWITIEADSSGGGSHKINVYLDGSTTPTSFHVTIGSGSEDVYSDRCYLALGCSASTQSGSVDVDFFAYKPGVILPCTAPSCSWMVDGCGATRAYLHDFPEGQLSDVVYTISNTGQTEVPYTVSVSYDNPEVTGWVTLAGAMGTLAPDESAAVTAMLDKTILAAAPADAVYEATLTFAASACSCPSVVRPIRVRALPAGTTHVWQYEGDVDPFAPDSAGPGLAFGLLPGEGSNNQAQGSVADDPTTKDGKAWHLVDIGVPSTKTKFVGTSFNPSTQGYDLMPTVHDEIGATVIARLRVDAYSSTDTMLAIYDTTMHASLHWGGAVTGLIRETRNGINVDPGVANPADYIVARVTSVGLPLTTPGYACSRLVRIYVNENPDPVLTIVAQRERNVNSSNPEGIGFGAGSSSGTADIWFDWVSGTNAGAFAPGEEQAVLGRSLVPGCGVQITPATPMAFQADINHAATPTSDSFTVSNIGARTVTYTVSVVDELGNPAAKPAWLLWDHTGGTLPTGSSDVIPISTDPLTPGLADGTYKAYLLFTDSCVPANVETREIVLDVYGSRWTVDSCSVQRAFLADYPNAPIAGAAFTITNAAYTPVDYHVTATYDDPSCSDWVVMTDATGSLAAPDGSAQVGISIDHTKFIGAATNQIYTATLTFADAFHLQATRTIQVRSVPAGAVRVWNYEGDVDPMMDSSAGLNLSFGLLPEGSTNVSQGAVESDPEARDGFAWRIQDTDTAKTKFLSLAEGHPVSIYNEVGVTVVGRFKVMDYVTPELMLGIYDYPNLFAAYHWGGANGRIREIRRDGLVETGLGTTDYIVGRMTAVGTMDADFACHRLIRLYLNEDPTPILELVAPSANTKADQIEGFGFGAGSTTGTADLWFDWVSGTNAGAFAPGEEVAVLGASLTAARCPKPFADSDADGDVDLADFANWQRCYTGDAGSMPTPTICACLDRNHDGVVSNSDLAWFMNCFSGPGVPATPSCED